MAKQSNPFMAAMQAQMTAYQEALFGDVTVWKPQGLAQFLDSATLEVNGVPPEGVTTVKISATVDDSGITKAKSLIQGLEDAQATVSGKFNPGYPKGNFWLDEAWWSSAANTKFTDEVKASMQAQIDNAVKDMLASKGVTGLVDFKGQPLEIEPSPGYSVESFQTLAGTPEKTFADKYAAHKKSLHAALYGGVVQATNYATQMNHVPFMDEYGGGAPAGIIVKHFDGTIVTTYPDGSVFYNTGNSNSYASAGTKLQKAIPGLNTVVECPACAPRQRMKLESGYVEMVHEYPSMPLIKLVIHLNDDHAWPRVEKDRVARGLREGHPNIADWLDATCADLGIDQTFRPETDPPGPASHTQGFSHSAKAMAELESTEFYVNDLDWTPLTSQSTAEWLKQCQWPETPSSVDVLPSGAFKFTYKEE